jgi:CheY-like chemotaxis protein
MTRVLIVEDDAAIATILAMLLGMLGFDTATAGDGAQALRVLAGGLRPDALLLDIRLPSCGPDGVALARMVRARPDGARIAVLLMTAESYDEDATLLEAGADAFIRKPVPDADELATIIRRHVEMRAHAPRTRGIQR